MKVVVLGAGYTGNVIARDLAEDPFTDVSIVVKLTPNRLQLPPILQRSFI